jgi:hypothetical protein
MSNGDPLAIGIMQPPHNRATAGTLLVHDGSSFGTQHTAFWVQRLGAPECNSAIRGDNLSTGSNTAITRVGVTGTIEPGPNRFGVVGTIPASTVGIYWGETGVLGESNSFGVVGRAFTGVVDPNLATLESATGVVGQCDTGVGVHGKATSGWGIIGQSVDRAGVTGTSANASGVDGRSEQATGVTGSSANGLGVEGTSSQGLAGVLGRSNSRYGVFGTTESGVGVYGESPANAVLGRALGSEPRSIGVGGIAEAGVGVQGASNVGIGVAGVSRRGWAGYFDGNVMVSGNFYVNGTKSAAVAHPDGTTRAVFAVESPESYFEDFGETVVEGQSVTVELDPDFAPLVQRNSYQVFLTSYGPEALYVRARRADSFDIARMATGGQAKPKRIRVGYRIVARRANVKHARLPTVDAPSGAGELEEPSLPRRRGRRTATGIVTAQAELERLPAAPDIPRLSGDAFDA